MTLTGLFVPLITPFDAAGAVCHRALAALAHRVLDDGATGLVALGTTAEPESLTSEERHAVLDTVAAICVERGVPLVVGANTAPVLAALAGWNGVTAALTVVPPFVRPGEEAVVAHFERLAAASPLPIVVYHIPYRTGQDLSAATLCRLAARPGIAGVKYAPGAVTAETLALLDGVPSDFAVLGGDDGLLSPLLALGAAGAIAASAHVATASHAALVAAWRTGDVPRAHDLGSRLAALSTALFAEPNPTVIKGVLHAHGQIPTPAVRAPLLPAGPATVDAALTLEALTVGAKISGGDRA